MRFGKIAIREGIISSEQLKEALRIQKQKGDWPIGEILAFLGYIDDADMRRVLDLQHRSPNGAQAGTTAGAAADDAVVPVLDLEEAHEKATGKVLNYFGTRMFGRYQILDEIGSGGMGRVYKAYDSRLDRLIALKVLISGGAASPKQIERFLREARATAKLRHPNIVRLYDIGTEDGQNYFTMDFLEGLSLNAYVQKFLPTIFQRVAIMIKVGNAVHHAHTQDVIHRDIKPTNILVDAQQEPKVMDFGLAKMVSADDHLSKTGDVLGTPAYMSPEQSESKTIDSRSDVYSLGATLYEVLVGKPPFQGESYIDILHKIVHKDPPAPRKLKPDIPSNLEAICLKCLEKDPGRRYQSALQFVEDLQNFLDNEPILAKPPSLFASLAKLISGRRTWQVLLPTVLALLLLGIFLYFVRWQKAKSEKELATLRENRQREAAQGKMTVAKIALAGAEDACRKRDWRKCGALAGLALENAGDVKSIEAFVIKSAAASLLRQASMHHGFSAGTERSAPEENHRGVFDRD